MFYKYNYNFLKILFICVLPLIVHCSEKINNFIFTLLYF